MISERLHPLLHPMSFPAATLLSQLFTQVIYHWHTFDGDCHVRANGRTSSRAHVWLAKGRRGGSPAPLKNATAALVDPRRRHLDAARCASQVAKTSRRHMILATFGYPVSCFGMQGPARTRWSRCQPIRIGPNPGSSPSFVWLEGAFLIGVLVRGMGYLREPSARSSQQA